MAPLHVVAYPSGFLFALRIVLECFVAYCLYLGQSAVSSLHLLHIIPTEPLIVCQNALYTHTQNTASVLCHSFALWSKDQGNYLHDNQDRVSARPALRRVQLAWRPGDGADLQDMMRLMSTHPVDSVKQLTRE